MMGITAILAYASTGINLGGIAYIGLFIASIALLFAIRAFQNSWVGLALLAVFSALSGLTLGPVLGRYLAIPNGSQLILSAAGLTAIATFICAAVVTITKKSFSQLRTFLFVSTLLLVVGYLISFFAEVPGLTLGLTLIGTVLFIGWLLMDLGEVINGVQTNYISASISIYLNILNLFTHILRLLGWASEE